MVSTKLSRALRNSFLALALGPLLVLGVAPAFAQSLEPADAGAIAPADTPVEASPAPAPAASPAPVVPADPPAPTIGSASPAPTVPVGPQTSLERLVDTVATVVLPAFSALIMGLVALLLNWLRRRFKLQVSDQQIDAWAKIATESADRAAEWARAKAKSAAEGKKVPGPDVLDVAVNWGLDMGETMKLPQLGREKLIGLIEAQLFKGRKEPR